MSLLETAEERADRLFRDGGKVGDHDHIMVPDRFMGDSESVDMDHQPGAGEVPGMRASMDRQVRQLVEAGNDHNYARKVAQRCAHRLERRLARRTP